MGSKNRYAKYLLPIILENRKPDQWYVEPFVGGGNMIDKVDGNRIGADINPHLIEALKLIRDDPQQIPDIITEDDYVKARIEQKLCVTGLVGFIGFSMSYGGKWFGGYRRDVAGQKGDIQNMKTQTRRSKQNAIKQSKKLQGIKLYCSSYDKLFIPENSIVYCDIPYAGTTKYKNNFDHDKFWDWARQKESEGHSVFVSEYTAPNDFEVLWQKEVNRSLTKNTGAKKGIEKLFRLKRIKQL